MLFSPAWVCVRRRGIQEQVRFNKLINVRPPVFNSSEIPHPPHPQPIAFHESLWAAAIAQGLRIATAKHMRCSG